MKILKYFPPIYQMIIWPICRLLLNYFCYLKISGVENLKDIKSGIILASNHTTGLDPVIIRSALPWWGFHKATYAVSLTKENYHTFWGRIFFGGWFFKIAGGWPAYRKTGDYNKTFVHHIELLNNKRAVIIFPEGRRNWTGEKIKAKPGISHLAEITQAPILPILIEGQRGINLWRFFTRQHKISIYFGQPIKIEDILNNININQNEDKYTFVAEKILEIIFSLNKEKKEL
ncbi:MAG TPA: 1-acyl-sn-glycerol-3-phosphate acyltransferase [Candidatus Vogelbacteria bacterium]|nr:1-acyl-sn-glycerol-3-phosphate acyltransferase [Candidatus Vogelbacteria bacterium]